METERGGEVATQSSSSSLSVRGKSKQSTNTQQQQQVVVGTRRSPGYQVAPSRKLFPNLKSEFKLAKAKVMDHGVESVVD